MPYTIYWNIDFEFEPNLHFPNTICREWSTLRTQGYYGNFTDMASKVVEYQKLPNMRYGTSCAHDIDKAAVCMKYLIDSLRNLGIELNLPCDDMLVIGAQHGFRNNKRAGAILKSSRWFSKEDLTPTLAKDMIIIPRQQNNCYAAFTNYQDAMFAMLTLPDCEIYALGKGT
jgi:hypothetical protein